MKHVAICCEYIQVTALEFQALKILEIPALDLFSGVHAIFLLLLCYFISTSIFKHVYSIGTTVSTVLCMVNLQLGYNELANHYILDLRPEYGDDIVEITSAIFQSFTYQLPFLKHTKRRLRRGQTKRFIKKCGWRLQMVRSRRKTDRSIIHKTAFVAVDSSHMKVLSQGLQLGALPEVASASKCTTKSSVSLEPLEIVGPIEETDKTNKDIIPLKFQGQSAFLAGVSDTKKKPEAQLTA